MARKDILTNEQIVKNLMNYNKHGALGQVFIMTAIEKYAEMVMEAPDSPENDLNALIPMVIWKSTAQDVLNRLAELRAR